MKPLSREGTPRQLGRFELVAELASGGMATVYLGRLGGAGGFQRFVAIKRLHSHLANDSEFVDMFLDEARLAARLHHPNVVPILEIGQSDDSGYYLVMEYVEGETLARLLNLSHQAGSPVPTNVTVRIFLDTLAGLHAAHELVGDDGMPLEIVHRDVSPQNVLVGVEGSAKITDFGVAHAADRLAHTRTGQLKGKFSYMAPEQALGSPVDRRADLFAIGTCLWEAFACKRLFKGDNEADTLEKVLRGPVPRLRTLNRNIHPAIEQVVARALERDPAKRFPTAAAFAEQLELAATQAGVLGLQRDVTSHVQRVLGPLLIQQREAVRAWIAGMEQQGPHVERHRGDRGPTTRVDVPARNGAAPARREGSASVMRQEVATVAPKRAPLLQDAEAAPVDTRPSADSSGSVAVATVERTSMTAVRNAKSSSMLPTFAIAALVVAVGALVGITRLQSTPVAEGADAQARVTALGATPSPSPSPSTPAAAATGVGSAASAATVGTVSNATIRLGAPPVPTTPLTPFGSKPATPPTVGATTPTVSITELPAARAAAPAAAAPAPRVRSTPRYEAPRAAAPADDPEPRVERPRREREREREPRAERPERGESNDSAMSDDLGRNPYRTN